ncbi:MAG: T9SS type A sorting domain-containing protein [Chitinophagaceae bacterium]|nr:T9SS type A sorting domain-containing protein [Chitinophagaceae bacterium]
MVGTGAWSIVSGAGSITDAASPTSTVTGVTVGQTTILRWTITNGTCSSQDDVSLTNDQLSNGGTLSGSAEVCPTTNSTTLTLGAYTGTIVKWQSSGVSDFSSGVSDIVNTTNTYTATNLSADTYFRVVVQNGSCSVANSSIASVTITNTYTWTGTNSTAWSDVGNWGCGVLPVHTTDVVIPSGLTNYPLISNVTNAVLNDISIAAGASVTVQGSLEIAGAISNSGSFDATAGTIEMDGTLAQTIPAGAFNGNIGTLRIDNTAGVTLGESKTAGTLVLVNGLLDLGANTLTVTSVSGGSATSYVRTQGAGVLKVNIGNTVAAVIPVGNSAYNPVTITNNSGAGDDFDVRVLDEVYDNGFNGSILPYARVQRTWMINKTNPNGGAGVDFVFNWNSGETTGSLVVPRMFHYQASGSRWVKEDGTTSYPTATSLSFTGYMGSFSPFAIIDNQFTLPVSWLSFTAVKHDQVVWLNWSTVSERNSRDYTIQHSVNGQQWSDIGNLPAAGNSNSVSIYSFTHHQPVTGINYYRLVETDMDGHATYSKVVVVIFTTEAKPLIVYPNPVSDGRLNVQVQQTETIRLYNHLGELVMTKEFQPGTQVWDLSRLARGVYILKAGKETERIVIQ